MAAVIDSHGPTGCSSWGAEVDEANVGVPDKGMVLTTGYIDISCYLTVIIKCIR